MLNNLNFVFISITKEGMYKIHPPVFQENYASRLGKVGYLFFNEINMLADAAVFKSPHQAKIRTPLLNAV